MQSFDPKNGQIYTETTSSTRSMTSKWKLRTTGRPTNPTRYKNHTTGASTLRDMALRSCCWNVQLFLPETLKEAEWWYTGMIYRRLKETDTLSYAAWSLFHAAFPAQPDLTHNFSIMHSDTTHSWNSIILSLGQLTNAATLFSISGLTLSLQHLLSLITIPSLAMLVHLHPNQVATQPLSISDLRIWLRAVREKQACRELKVLVLGALGDDEGAPVKLDHLSSFPALAVVGITRSVLRRPTKSRRHATEEKQDEIGTHWERAEKKRSEEYTAILYGEGSYAQCPMAERTQRLFTSINLLSETEKNDRSPVRLSLTCHGDAVPRGSGLPDVAWFIRRRCEPEKTNKRAPDTVMPQDKNDTRAKQRKIRQGKQQDVGALLGMFG